MKKGWDDKTREGLSLVFLEAEVAVAFVGEGDDFVLETEFFEVHEHGVIDLDAETLLDPATQLGPTQT